jgi:hypothetical protein
MDLNPQYAMCGTAARDVAVSPDGKEREGGLFPGGNTKRLYNLEDVLVEHPFRALTFMLRNGLVRLPDWFETVPYGDMCILALYAEKGPIACLNEVTGAYRMHAGGIWSGCSMSEKCKAIRKTLDILNRHFSGRYIKTLRDRDFRVSKMICLGGVNKGRNLEAIQAYWGSFCRFAPYMPVSYLMLGFLLIWLPLRTRFAVRTRVRRLLRGCKRH